MITYINDLVKNYLQDNLEVLELDEFDFNFEVPTKDASAKFERDTISIYLLDLKENLLFRQNQWETNFDNKGMLQKSPPTVLLDIYILVSIFTKKKEIEKEHQLFSKVLSYLYNPNFITYLNNQAPVTLSREISCELFPQKYIDEHLGLQLWSAIDQNIRPIISLKITAPLIMDISEEMTPVQTKEIKYALPDKKLYKINGLIMAQDEENNFPLQALIELKNQGGDIIQTAQSNIHGVFNLSQVDTTSHTVNVIAQGYQEKNLPIENIEMQSSKQLIITLERI